MVEALSYTEETKVFGYVRLRTLEFLESLCKSSYVVVLEAVIKSGILGDCLDLIFKFQNNSFCLSKVCDIFTSICAVKSDDLFKLV